MRIPPIAPLALALLALAAPGCGGGSSEGASTQSTQADTSPKEDGAEPAEHTPESCLGDAGVDAMSKPNPKVWLGQVSKAGFTIRIQKFGSPAAAHRAVVEADGVAFQANFLGVFGPPEGQDEGSTAAVARCLRGTL